MPPIAPRVFAAPGANLEAPPLPAPRPFDDSNTTHFQMTIAVAAAVNGANFTARAQTSGNAPRATFRGNGAAGASSNEAIPFGRGGATLSREGTPGVPPSSSEPPAPSADGRVESAPAGALAGNPAGAAADSVASGFSRSRPTGGKSLRDTAPQRAINPLAESLRLQITAPQDLKNAQIRVVLPASLHFGTEDANESRVVWNGDFKDAATR